MSTVTHMAGVALVAGVLSWLLVSALCRWAQRHRVLDVPNERSSHTQPTPLGGGLALVLVTVGGWLVCVPLAQDSFPRPAVIYVTGAVMIAAVSWSDDLHPMPSRVRFAVHCAAAALTIAGSGYWSLVELPFLGQLSLAWLGMPLTFLWIVGLTNAYNFMDGVDGIAGTQALISGLGWSILGVLSRNLLVGLLGTLIAGSSIGFLAHNWPPARIFMGDVGSAFLGYSLAVLPLIAVAVEPRLALAGVLLVWPFVFDTCFTFLRRLRNREDVFAAHRSHLYQRLVAAGYSHRRVTVLYAGHAVVGLLAAVGWSRGLPGCDVVVLGVPVLCFALWSFVCHQERSYVASVDKRTGSQLHTL